MTLDLTDAATWKQLIETEPWLQSIFCEPVTITAHASWNTGTDTVSRQQWEELVARIEKLEREMTL